MSAEFLAALAGEGRTVVTVLRTDQYTGVESFREVGEFVPLQADRQGKVIREVALARFSLPLPEQGVRYSLFLLIKSEKLECILSTNHGS
jgi:hypothetical protein